MEIEDNDVYIGFKMIPPDLRTIVSAAAFHGNKAYGFRVHVWAIDAKYKGWRPGVGPFYCTATARYGKLEMYDQVSKTDYIVYEYLFLIPDFTFQ